MSPVRLGVSACLLGERVRWDGGDRRDAWLAEVLAPHVELVPVCPEVGVGMGVPREPVQLVAEAPGAPPRLRGVQSARDWTDALKAWAEGTLDALEAQGPLAGFVLKARSPSCGLAVPVLGAPATCGGASQQVDQAPGLFAAAVRARGLPTADEVALADPTQRDAFLARALTRAHALSLRAGDDVRAFHAAHRDLLRWLVPRRGALVRLAAASDLGVYRDALLGALAHAPPPGRLLRALAARARALRATPSPGERAVARAALVALRDGRVAPDVPRACLRRLSRAHGREVDLLLAPPV